MFVYTTKEEQGNEIVSPLEYIRKQQVKSWNVVYAQRPLVKEMKRTRTLKRDAWISSLGVLNNGSATDGRKPYNLAVCTTTLKV